MRQLRSMPAWAGWCLGFFASAGLLVVTGAGTASAGELDAAPTDSTGGFLADYFRRVEATQSEQPHWITPLFTTTPRLEQEVRYDVLWQTRPKFVNFENYGVGKGLELIPLDRVEVIVGIPAYQILKGPAESKRGWADETFLLKYRALSSNEEHGNYIVTGFLGVSVPSGGDAFTAGRTIYTPTLAAGKGWGTRQGGFDIQTTVAVSIPSGDKDRIGIPLVWNTAFQAHILDEHFWPEVEYNYTHWTDGPNDGKTQALVTVGAVLGRLPLTGRLRLVLGAGYQQAVSTFRTYDHAWVMSLRTPF